MRWIRGGFTLLLELCPDCFEAMETLESEDKEGLACLVEDGLRIPRGGLDKVVILRAEAPSSAGGRSRRWVQLGFCDWCASSAGQGALRTLGFDGP